MARRVCQPSESGAGLNGILLGHFRGLSFKMTETRNKTEVLWKGARPMECSLSLLFNPSVIVPLHALQVLVRAAARPVVLNLPNVVTF